MKPIVNLVSPPPSGEAPIPFDDLVAAARAALPADLPTNPAKVLIGLDLDGTVLLPTGVSSRVREAIADCATAGVHAVIATGRSLEATAPVMPQLGDPNAWAVCSNGAIRVHFHDEHEGGSASSHVLTFDPAPLIDRVRELVPDVLIGIESPGVLYLSAPFPPGEIIEHFEVRPLGDLREEAAIKAVFRAPWMDRDDFAAIMEGTDLDEYEVSVGWTSWADVLPRGVTKASGLRALADDLGVPLSGTIAVGDGTNDLSMIRWANLGVVMGGADAKIKAAGDHVTGAVENDGAAAVMRAVLDHCGFTR